MALQRAAIQPGHARIAGVIFLVFLALVALYMATRFGKSGRD
jgi:lipopolysaccharide export LptBFGC system permease protein LptF